MKLTLTKVSRNEKTSKAGKPYVSIGIKTVEHGDKYLNGFGNKENAVWKEGDVVEANVVENGQYLNFEMPKKTDAIAQGVGDLEKKVEDLTTLCLRIYECVKPKAVKQKDDMPEF